MEFKGKPKHIYGYENAGRTDTIFLTILASVALQDTRHIFIIHFWRLWIRLPTNESSGEAWGFSLVYTGSFSVDVEKGSQGFTRARLGLKPQPTLLEPRIRSIADNAGMRVCIFHKWHRRHVSFVPWPVS